MPTGATCGHGSGRGRLSVSLWLAETDSDICEQKNAPHSCGSLLCAAELQGDGQ